jgi:hypothetical protein
VLEGRLATAEREAAKKSEKLARVRGEGRDPAVVEQAEHEAEMTAQTRDEIAEELDSVKDGEKE